MRGNPIIERYAASLLRPSQVWIAATIYAVAVAILLLVDAAIYQRHPGPGDPGVWVYLYNHFLIFQAFTLCVLGGFNSGAAIRNEMREKTYDFFRLLPMSACRKTIGIVVGRNLLVLLMAAVNGGFLLAFGKLGGVAPALQSQLALVLVAFALLINLAALLGSVGASRKTGGPTASIAFVFAAIFATPFLIQAAGRIFDIQSVDITRVFFYGLRVPLLVAMSLTALYFAVWVLVGIARAFDLGDEPLFTRGGAVLFLMGFELAVLGFFRPQAGEKSGLGYFFWTVSLVPLLLLPLGAMVKFDKYLERSWAFQRDGKVFGMREMLRVSNVAVWLALLLVWGLFASVESLMLGMSVSDSLQLVLALLSFCLVFLLLAEVGIVYTPVNGKVMWLVGFVSLLILLLPLVASVVLNSETLHLYCLPGFFGELLGEAHAALPVDRSVWTVNLLLCVVPCALIWRRYRFALSARRSMV